MGVLGALHQFVPVVTHRPLRSVPLVRATFPAWLAASWLLPLGVAAVQEDLTETGGELAAVAVGLLAANLWAPLSVRGQGPGGNRAEAGRRGPDGDGMLRRRPAR